jgi:hypothetical protein
VSADVSRRNQAALARVLRRDIEHPPHAHSEDYEPAIEPPCDVEPVDQVPPPLPPLPEHLEAMVRGLGRAAARYEQSGRMNQADGSLWDDDSRNALAMARELGLAPPRQAPDWRDDPAPDGPPMRTVTGPLFTAMIDLQGASIRLEDAFAALRVAQQEHTEKTVAYCRLLAAEGRVK